MIAAPRGFRRTRVLERALPGLLSRDPGLTNCLRNQGRSTLTPLGLSSLRSSRTPLWF